MLACLWGCNRTQLVASNRQTSSQLRQQLVDCRASSYPVTLPTGDDFCTGYPGCHPPIPPPCPTARAPSRTFSRPSAASAAPSDTSWAQQQQQQRPPATQQHWRSTPLASRLHTCSGPSPSCQAVSTSQQHQHSGRSHRRTVHWARNPYSLSSSCRLTAWRCHHPARSCPTSCSWTCCHPSPSQQWLCQPTPPALGTRGHTSLLQQPCQATPPVPGTNGHGCQPQHRSQKRQRARRRPCPRSCGACRPHPPRALRLLLLRLLAPVAVQHARTMWLHPRRQRCHQLLRR